MQKKALSAIRALSELPDFSHVATRKLQDLQERGYSITGYAIEKPVEGSQPERGFITAGGFVGWWRDAGVSFTAVAAPPVKQIHITQALSREVEPQQNSPQNIPEIIHEASEGATLVALDDVIARLEQGFGKGCAPVTTLLHHFGQAETAAIQSAEKKQN